MELGYDYNKGLSYGTEMAFCMCPELMEESQAFVPPHPQTNKSFAEDCSWVKRVKGSWPRDTSVQRLSCEVAVGNSPDVGEVSVLVLKGAHGAQTTESTAFPSIALLRFTCSSKIHPIRKRLPQGSG